MEKEHGGTCSIPRAQGSLTTSRFVVLSLATGELPNQKVSSAIPRAQGNLLTHRCIVPSEGPRGAC